MTIINVCSFCKPFSKRNYTTMKFLKFPIKKEIRYNKMQRQLYIAYKLIKKAPINCSKLKSNMHSNNNKKNNKNYNISSHKQLYYNSHN